MISPTTLVYLGRRGEKKIGGEDCFWGGGAVRAHREICRVGQRYWHDLQCFVDVLSSPTFSSSLMNYKKILTLDDFKPYTDKSRKMPLPFH